MSKILITGGAGSIGSELVRQLAPKHKIFILDNNETALFDLVEELQQKKKWVYGRVGDIRSMDTVFDVFSDFKPDIVIHAAALKHVKPNEIYPIEAILTNVVGTFNVLQQAKNFNTKKFVLISSDKAVNAKSVMGQTKLLAETMVRNAGFVVVRFGNVLRSRGSVLSTWERQVQNKEPITITDKRMTRYFMSIQDACALVVEAMKVGKAGETVIFEMGKPISILDLKEKLYPKYPVKYIGMRAGESLTETLMTHEEQQRVKKRGKFYIV